MYSLTINFDLVLLNPVSVRSSVNPNCARAHLISRTSPLFCVLYFLNSQDLDNLSEHIERLKKWKGNMLQKFINKIFLLVSISFIVSCTINEPYLPAWDTRVKLHFRSDQFSMSEILTENSFKDSLDAVLGDTLIYVSISDSTEPQVINEDDLAFKSDDDQIIEKIGDIKLDSVEQGTPAVTMSELFPGLTIEPGITIPPIPDATLTPPANTVRFDNYQSIVVKEGLMYLIFHNNLIFEIKPGLTISVFDSVTNLFVNDFIFTEKISPGESKQSLPVELNNKTLFNVFRLEYQIPIMGIGSRTLTQSDVNSNFVVDVSIASLTVSSATAKIPSQRVDRIKASPLNTEDKSLKIAKIKKGKIFLEIENNFPLGANLKINILSMVDENEDSVIVNLDIPKGNTVLREIDLAGFTIRHHKFPGTAIVDSIHYNIVAVTDSSDGFITINSDEEITVNVSMDSTFVSYFEGGVSNLEIPIDPVVQSDLIDFSDFDGSFRLPDVVFTLNFYNQINFDVDLDLTITGVNNNNNQQVVLNVLRTLLAGTSENPQLTVITLNGDNSTIVDLMAILPTSIKMEGKAVVNGTGSVALSDAIWSDYTIESPLKIKIDSAIFVTTDMDSIASDDLDNDFRESITEDFSEVFININTENGLPLGSVFKFFLAADSTDLFNENIVDSTQKVIISAELDAGETDQNGLVSQSANKTIILGLSQQQLQIFNSKPIYYGAKIKINSNEQAVTFRKNDLLKYDGFIDIKVRVDLNDD